MLHTFMRSINSFDTLMYLLDWTNSFMREKYEVLWQNFEFMVLNKIYAYFWAKFLVEKHLLENNWFLQTWHKIFSGLKDEFLSKKTKIIA